jgi:N-acetylglucosamine-6-phosphate deacetylase
VTSLCAVTKQAPISGAGESPAGRVGDRRHGIQGSGSPATTHPRGLAARTGASEAAAAPGLLDPQINGFAGVDFQRDGVTSTELVQAVQGLKTAGCTRCLVTLVTDRWESLLGRLRQLRNLRAGLAELPHAIAGWHLEGPFLSEKPGFHGAHDPALMLDPTPARIRELREAAGDDLLLLTLAPERAGGIKAIELAVSLGMKVSLGHTDASAACLRDAISAGATGFTHLGNACPQQLDRHDNILWRVLDLPGLTVSLIPDQRHVSPALFRLIHRVLPSERIIYTTDAMAAAGAPPGRYRLGRLELEVGEDRIVRQPGRTNFAGSALTPVEAVFSAAEMLGVPWQATWSRMSVNPARWLELPPSNSPSDAPGD